MMHIKKSLKKANNTDLKKKRKEERQVPKDQKRENVLNACIGKILANFESVFLSLCLSWWPEHWFCSWILMESLSFNVRSNVLVIHVYISIYIYIWLFCFYQTSVLLDSWNVSKCVGWKCWNDCANPPTPGQLPEPPTSPSFYWQFPDFCGDPRGSIMLTSSDHWTLSLWAHQSDESLSFPPSFPSNSG